MVYVGFENEREIKIYIYNEKLQNKKEIWKRIYINNEKTIYTISNFGKIKNSKTKKLLTTYDCHGYLRVKLKHGDKSYFLTIHRLVAINFCKVPKRYIKKGLTMDDLVVNHKNGIKTCNASFNLEWVTSKENTDHAWREGLCDSIRGENTHLAEITEETAKQIIEKIMQRKNNGTIVNELKDYGVTKSIVQHIRSKSSWIYLSKNLKFPKLGEDKRYTMSEETIHTICKLLEEKQYSDYAIGKMVGVSREYVKDIRHKKRRRSISQYYNF